jgi:hypothetical protein
VTDLDELIAFTRARFDDAERFAYLLGGTTWTAVDDGVFVQADPMPRDSIAQACSPFVAQWMAACHPRAMQRDLDLKRAILATAIAIPHRHVEDDSWFSCSQAVSEWVDDAEPGSGCSNEDRAGKPCDCGRNELVWSIACQLASEFAAHPQYLKKWAP